MENKLLNFIIKIICIYFFIYFIQKYDVVNTINKLINNEMTLKESFNNIILPKEKAIKLKIKDQLPYGKNILKLGLLQKNHYLDDLGDYFRKNIFPVKLVNTNGCIDNINKLIKGELDLAFIDEETFANYINDDIHLRIHLDLEKLQNINFALLGVCFYQSFIFVTKENSKIFEFEDIKRVKYKNRGAPNIIIGVLNKYNTDYYHLLKLLYLSNTSYNIKTGDVYIYTCSDYSELKEKFITGEFDIVYLTTNKKNKVLKDISNETKVRYITPYYNLDKYKNINYSELITKYNLPSFITNNKNNQIYFSKNIKFYVLLADFADFKELIEICKIFIPDNNNYNNIINKQTTKFKTIQEMNMMFNKTTTEIKLYFLPQHKSITDNSRKSYIETLKLPYYFIDFNNSNRFLDNIEKVGASKLKQYTDFNALVKNRFHFIFNNTINLNTSFNNINTNKQLKTYASRLLLVARNSLDKKHVEQIVENFINNLDDLQIHMNEYMNFQTINNNNKNSIQNKNKIMKILDPYNENAFNFNELISVKDIPIHIKAKHIYEKYGLIKSIVIEETNVFKT